MRNSGDAALTILLCEQGVHQLVDRAHEKLVGVPHPVRGDRAAETLHTPCRIFAFWAKLRTTAMEGHAPGSLPDRGAWTQPTPIGNPSIDGVLRWVYSGDAAQATRPVC
jgi:hypothetical protein